MKCTCGVNGSCTDPGFCCNCDLGDKAWREDNGKNSYVGLHLLIAFSYNICTLVSLNEDGYGDSPSYIIERFLIECGKG